MEIRQSIETDRSGIARVHADAFGDEEGPVIVELVNALFDDETARPLLSLVAHKDGRLIGHILFTKASLDTEGSAVKVQILAPMAVCPDWQNQGVGHQLIEQGLKQLREAGMDLVFVLGHPSYYPKLGFQTAGALGFRAPYPIPDKHTDAWMVQALKEGVIGHVSGKVQCSTVLNQPQYWRE